MSTTDDLLARALELPEADRADLAYRLILSLDSEEPDPDWEASWKTEIESRLRALDEGRTTLIPWEEVRDRIRQSLSRGQRP